MDDVNYPNPFSTIINAIFLGTNSNLVTFRGTRQSTLLFVLDMDAPIILKWPIVVTFYLPSTYQVNPLINMFPLPL